MDEKAGEIAPKKRNLIALVVGVLFKPKATFLYLKENRKKSWWIPALVSLLLILAPIIIAGMQPVQPEGVMHDPMMGSASAYEGEIYLEGGAMSGEPGMGMQPPGPSGPGILSLAVAILGTPLSWVLWGGALYLTSVFLGRSSGFREMFRLTVWGWLPYAVRGLVQSIYIMLANGEITNAGLSGLVQSSMPSIVPLGPGELVLASVLSNIEIYAIWYLLIISAGLVAFTNLPPKKARIATLSVWLVFILLRSVFAIARGMFGIG